MYKCSFNYMSKLPFTIKDQEQNGWPLFLLLKQISVFFGKMCLGYENSPCMEDENIGVFLVWGKGEHY